MAKTKNTQQKDVRRFSDRGFTLLEMIIVASIIVILATLAAARYDIAVMHAHEAAQAQDLAEMNKAIQNYTVDKEEAPTSLDDLVPQYLGRIPNDPVTGANDWVTENCDMLLSVDQTTTGICSVHSATSNGVSQ